MAKIEIQPSFIKIWKTASNILGFSTEKKYLKTDASGVFKVGGYARCPVICGQSAQYVVDQNYYGGYPPFDGLDNDWAGWQTFSITIISGINPALSQLEEIPSTWQGTGTPAIDAITTSNILNENGVVIGTFDWRYTDLNGWAVVYLKNVNITDPSISTSGGILTFVKTFTNMWRRVSDNTPVDMTPYNYANFWNTPKDYFIQTKLWDQIIPSTSLSLAVTP